MSIIISTFLLLLYVFIIYSSSKKIISLLRKQEIFYQFLYSIALIFPGLLIVFLLKDEQYIYTWDFSGYWKKSIVFTSKFFESPFLAFEEIYKSINHDEYNYSANLLLAPLNKALGLNFENYVFSVYLIYLVPIALLSTNFLIQITETVGKKMFLLLPFLILIFTPFLIPIRFGFIDIVGLIPIFIILNILVEKDFLRKFEWKSSIIIGFSILFLVFFRRWYAFWAVAFFLTVFILNLIYSIKFRDFKILLYSTINLFLAGIFPTLIILLFFYPFFEMSVLKDYEALYAGYRSSSYLQQFKNFIYFFGPFIILFSLIGGYLMSKVRKSLIFFLTVSTAILLVLFIRVNDIGGYQHFYLLLPLISSLFLYSVIYFSQKRIYISHIIIGLLIINNIIVFKYSDLPYKGLLFSKVDALPLIREDYNALTDIKNDLKKLDQLGYYSYCLSSSQILNDDLLQNIDLPNSLQPFKFLLPTKHIDKRDAFPNELFMASYVIVTNPVQIHLQPEAQQLIQYFNNEFENGKLQNHFQEFKTYQLSNNTQVKLLKKIKGFTIQETEEIKNHFKNLYPDFPQMYAVNELVLKNSEIQNGDNYGSVLFEDNKMQIHPGYERATTITFTIDSLSSYNVSFKAGFRNKQDIMNNCNPEKDGEIFLSIFKDDLIYEKFYITHKNDSIFSFEIKDTKTLKIGVDRGKNFDYCDWFEISDFQLEEH